MAVPFCPHYPPREFRQITVILVYAPGPDYTLAAERITASYNKAQRNSIDDQIFLLGDFNVCEFCTHQVPPVKEFSLL